MIDFYGGVKTANGIEGKIAMVSDTNLDLFDSVRFRIVSPTIGGLVGLQRVLEDRFGNHTVRCRNYYFRPRRGQLDPFRAVHLCLQSDDEEFIEIQLLTASRESVGHLDHAFVHKRTIEFSSTAHAQWLAMLSWTANIEDARLD